MLGSDIALCIAGNKIDLEKDRHVPAEEAERSVIDTRVEVGQSVSPVLV